MQEYINKIPFSHFFVYLVVGVVLFLFFKIISKYVIPILKDKQHSIHPWWQKIQILTWVLFFGIFYSSLLRRNLVTTLVFSVVILGLGWNFWKNLFSGILIRFKNLLRVGEYIATDFTKGKIESISLSQTELRNDQGELVIIPNYQLRSSVLKHIQVKNNVKVHTFLVSHSNDKTVEDIYQSAVNCPYVSSNQEIHVEKIGSDEFQIKVSIIDNSLVERVKNYFEK